MKDRTDRSRRQLLSALATGGVVALAGCPGEDWDGSSIPDGNVSTVRRVTGRVRPARSEYDTVVDVTEEGGDPTGEEPVTDVVEELADDRTLVEFPSGTYRMGPLWLSDFDQFGLRGVGEPRPRLVPSAPATRYGATWLNFSRVGAFEFQRFTFDFRAEEYGGRFHLAGVDDFLVREVIVEGQYPRGVGGFRFETLDSESTGVVERVRAPHGAPAGAGSTGIWVGYGHAGELYVIDCRIENFPDNGLYASAPGREGSRFAGDGPVHVLGGIYRDNNIANVRLGSTGSSARNVRVVATTVPPHDGARNVQGIQLRAGSDHLIENCEVELQEGAGEGLGGIVLHSDAGSATIRDSRIQVDRDEMPAINVLRPARRRPGPTMENVAIEGTAAAGSAVVMRNREGTGLEASDIVQNGPRRNGIFLVDVDATLFGSRISVTGDPIISYRSSITRRNLQTEAGDGLAEDAA